MTGNATMHFLSTLLLISAWLSSPGLQAVTGLEPAPVVGNQTWFPDNGAPLVVLKAQEEPIPARGGTAGLVADPACDRDGNMYFRPLLDSGLDSPIVRVSSGGDVSRYEGRPLAAASIRATPLAFTVDLWGAVYELTKVDEPDKEPSIDLVAYGADGRFKSEAKLGLPAKFEPSSFFALNSGNFLIAGKEKIQSSAEKASIRRSFAGVFAPDGTLVRRFKTMPQEKSSAKGDQLDEDLIQNYVDGQVGEDGYLYLLRGATSAAVDVVTESGRTIRTISLKSPLGNTLPFNLRLVGDRLLLMYLSRPSKGPGPLHENGQVIYTTFYVPSGNALTNYIVGNSVAGALACFGKDQLTFLSSRNGRLRVLHVRLD